MKPNPSRARFGRAMIAAAAACELTRGTVSVVSGEKSRYGVSVPPSPTPSPVSTSVGGGSGKLTVAWNANREQAVNSAGGGYRVYYSLSSTLDANTPYVSVPYASGASAPTSVRIEGLAPGSYTVNVVAYSAMNSAGSAAASATVVVK